MYKHPRIILSEFLSDLFAPGDNVLVGCLYGNGDHAKTVRIGETKSGVEEILKQIEEFDKQKKGATCICPNPVKEGAKRKIENIETLNAIYIDIDGKDLSLQGLPKPHYIFRRGEKNWHLYYLINREENTEENRGLYTQIAEKLIEKLKGDGQVKDVSRFLRFPYTYHDKTKGKGGVYELYEKNEIKRYDLKAFAKKLKIKEERTKEKQEVVETTKDDKEHKRANTDNIEKFLFLNKSILPKGEGRSRALYHFGLDCFSWGIEKERAVELGHEYNQKFCQPPEHIGVVNNQIKSAYKYARGNFGAYLETYNSDTKGAVQKAFDQFQFDLYTRERLAKWVYVTDTVRLINIDTGLELTSVDQIETFFSTLLGRRVTLKRTLEKQLLKVCDKMDFRPEKVKGDKIFRFYKSKDLIYFNRYAGLANIEYKKNDMVNKMFTEHLKFLTTTKEEYEHLLHYLAFLVQNPGVKMAHSVLLISQNEGIGKSLLELLLRNILQSKQSEPYVCSIENSLVSKGWTDFLAGKFVCFVHELAQGDKYTTMNQLKNLITEDTIRVEGKYARNYWIQNTTNFIFFSNLIDAVKISKNDRRLFVVYNTKKPKEAAYYEKLVQVFKYDYASIYHYLLSIDLSKFNPYGRPPVTKGKEQLQEQSESELSLFLKPLMLAGKGPFSSKVTTVPIIHSYVENLGPNSIKTRTGFKQIQAWLIAHEFEHEDVDKMLKISKGASKRFRCRIYKQVGVEYGLEDLLVLADNET